MRADSVAALDEVIGGFLVEGQKLYRSESD